MNTPSLVTIPGVILPDGTLDVPLDHGFPPGPVRVSLSPVDAEPDKNGKTISGLPRAEVPLSDPPIFDTAISAPCDLPLTGPSKRIYPRKLDKMPLPEPHDIDESME